MRIRVKHGNVAFLWNSIILFWWNVLDPNAFGKVEPPEPPCMKAKVDKSCSLHTSTYLRYFVKNDTSSYVLRDYELFDSSKSGIFEISRFFGICRVSLFNAFNNVNFGQSVLNVGTSERLF